MGLKLGKPEDADDFVHLTSLLVANSIYSKVATFDPEYIKGLYLAGLQETRDKISAVFLTEKGKNVGCIAFSKSHAIVTDKEEIATELLFYILPEYNNYSNKKKLLSAYFFWARKVGCKVALVGKLSSGNHPEQYYVRRL